MDENFTVKLADFGSSTVFHLEESIEPSVKAELQMYSAPEVSTVSISFLF